MEWFAYPIRIRGRAMFEQICGHGTIVQYDQMCTHHIQVQDIRICDPVKHHQGTSNASLESARCSP
jgi:hypothetical protein